MEKCLRLKYRYHDSDIVQVSVSVWNGRFGGAVELYIGHETLVGAADVIAGFPTSPPDRREFVLGAFGSRFAGGAVALRFYCRDFAGHGLMQVELEADYPDSGPTETASVICSVEAAAIDRFVPQLRMFNTEGAGEAVLIVGEGG